MLLMGLPLILMLISYTMMYLVKGEKLDLVSLLGTKTMGELIQPVKAVSELNLTDVNGQDFDHAKQEKRIWSMIVLGSPDCGQRCDDNLKQSRQMHIALGKQQSKIRRYYLYLDGQLTAKNITLLKDEHPDMDILYGSSSELKNLLSDQEIQDWNDLAYLLLDKRGWLMMTYTENVNERDIMKKDLHHLFKYAQ